MVTENKQKCLAAEYLLNIVHNVKISFFRKLKESYSVLSDKASFIHPPVFYIFNSSWVFIITFQLVDELCNILQRHKINK